MLNKSMAIAIALGLFTQSVWAEDGFTVSKQESPRYYNHSFIVITSRMVEVHLIDVVANRGNCVSVSKIPKPILMTFGGNIRFEVGCADPLEAKIVTDKGDYVVSW